MECRLFSNYKTLKIMLKLIRIFFISLLFVNCKNKDNHRAEIEVPPRQILADSTDGEEYIAILQLDSSKSLTKLSENEINTIEKLLSVEIDNHNKNFKENKIDLRFYKRQYFPQQNENGDTIVRIFCFCSVEDNDKWKTEEIISPKDGGKCYINILINLTKKTVSHFQTNGDA